MFVGRNAELAFLRNQLEEVRGSAARLVVVEGAAGIGKTALMREFLAETDGEVVLQASGAEEESILACGVISQLFAGVPTGTLNPANWRPQAVADPGTASRPDPIAAGSALLDLLGRYNDDGPAVLVVIDDAHWADTPSLQALTFAFRRLHSEQVLGLIATRDAADVRLPEGLRRLLANHGTRRVRLGGLIPADLRTLSGAFAAKPLSLRAAARLQAHTGGSPLHVRALLEQIPIDALSDMAVPLPAPRSYSLLVLARLASCSLQAQDLVRAVSVLGTSAKLHRAACLAGLHAPLSALEEALAAELLCEQPSTGPSRVVSFPHPLIRAAVYQDLGPAKRARLHARAAALADDDTAALYHRLQAAVGPDARLAEKLAALGRQRVAAGQWAPGGELLSYAARVAITDEERVRLTAEAIEALLINGQVDEAGVLMAGLIPTADPAVRCYAAGHLAAVAGRVPDAIELLTKAWNDRVRHAMPWLATRVAGQLAKLSARQGYGTEAAAWAARALELSNHRPGSDLIHFTRLAGLGMSGSIDQALALTAGLTDPAVATVAELDALLGRGLLRTWADDITGAVRDLTGVHAAGGNQSVSFQLLAAALLGQAEYRLGRWDDAIVHAEMAMSIACNAGQVALVPMGAAVSALVSAAQGDWGRAEASLNTARDSAKRTGSRSGLVYTASAEAHIAAARADPAHVIMALASVQDLGPACAACEPGIVPWQDLLVDALTAVGEYAHAESLLVSYETLAAVRGRHSAMANAARSRGNLNAARHDPVGAEAAFLAGQRHAARAANPFDRARLELAYGAFLRRSGKRTAATAHLEAARATLMSLRAQPYLERCNRELAACGQRPRGSAEAPYCDLTPQEHAVARLAASGMTNRQIARELVVSVKTIEYHLSHAYTKLNVRSRTALAAKLNGGSHAERATDGNHQR